jgi:hypothetical protein
MVKLWLLAALAQVSVEVDLSTQRLEPDDFLNVQIRAVAQGQGRIELEVPEIDGLTEVGRSRREGTSFSLSSSGKTVTRELVLSLDYSADRVGELVYPAVTARMGGESASSAPIPFRVGGDRAPPPAPVPPSGLPKGAVTPPRPDERDIFLRYELSTDRAFTGAQVLVDMVLYGRSLPRDVDPEPAPSPDGAWRQMLGDAHQLPRGRARVAGRTYQTVRLWRMALFGLQPGIIELPAYEAGVWMNAGPFARAKRLRRRSIPRQVEILPLPEAGRPAGFSAGNVGDYDFRARVDERQVDASRGVVLTLEAEGTGNLPQLQLPAVEGLDGFRVFPPTVTSNLEPSAGEVRGVKRAEILLTPTRTGELVIPPFVLSTFDAEQEAYVELKSRPIPISVRGTVAAPRTPSRGESAVAAPSPEEPEPVEEALELRPILPDPDPSAELDRLPLWAVAGSLGAPWAGALMLVLWRRRRRSRVQAPDLGPELEAMLEAATEGRTEAWVLARRCLLRRLGFDPEATPDLDRLEERLGARDLEPSMMALCKEVLAQADAARFAPEIAAVPNVERLEQLGALSFREVHR